ncbi:hypothetical protein [Treponema zioleckii]|uniref:hypothetical protein n=1 Tax=Treponema zioleckii TaxID=331680 RepID=UPI00168B716E|nr:hypothetical protein [Treponema zioleckii]
MKSLKSNFRLLFLGGILGVFTLATFVGFYYLHQSIEFHAGQALNYLSEKKVD